MWPWSPSCDEDACAPSPAPSSSPTLAMLPYAAILTASTLLALRLLFPRLSSAAHDQARDGEDHVLPRDAPPALRQAHAEHGAKSPLRRSGAWAFSATVGLATTLAALIMAEISGLVDPAAGSMALGVTVLAMLGLLVVVIPWLECRALLASAGWRFSRSAGGKMPRTSVVLHAVLFGAWLLVFWSVGRVLPPPAMPGGEEGRALGAQGDETVGEGLMRACLERIGVVGIFLMALLSGFAAVSAPWHTFVDASAAGGRRGRRPVSEADVNRKQVGLDATCEMLTTKRHRLQLLERRAAAAAAAATPTGGGSRGATAISKVFGSLRGPSGEEAEMRMLRVEIAGLATMEANLASSLSLLKTQRAAGLRAATPLGRMCLTPAHTIFSSYCLYRILATMLTTVRRLRASSSSSSAEPSFSGSDPINRMLGLLARHWDPALDQLAWARIISFVLSGVMLFASFSSAVQTFHLFARWTPGLLRHARAVLVLAVGQVVGAYVISASLLLRSQLPRPRPGGKMGMGIEMEIVGHGTMGGVLGGVLTPEFVDGWFEGWFLVGSAVTGVGLWVGGRMAGGEEEWDDYAMEEMGAKRS